MRWRRSPDPLARKAAIAMVVGRAGIGAAALLAARPALRSLGLDGQSGSARVLGRMAGARDLVLAGLMATRLDDGPLLRETTLAVVGADAADAAVFIGAGATRPELRKAAVISAPAALAAVAAGLWLADRL